MNDIIEIGLLAAILSLLLRRVEWSKALRSNKKIILDSCGLIDGRIVDIVAAGFLGADQLVIPEFVLRELQLLADGNDTHKRARARFGLDVARQLQDLQYVTVNIDRNKLESIKSTDDKLVALAKKLKAQLYTTDFNLNKVAVVEGVHVLNVNELTQSIRPVSLPGEDISIKVVQKGSNKNQGVGYLDDGTMVVIDNAAKYIGKNVSASVERMHQTVAGKMMFANLKAPNSNQKQR